MFIYLNIENRFIDIGQHLEFQFHPFQILMEIFTEIETKEPNLYGSHKTLDSQSNSEEEQSWRFTPPDLKIHHKSRVIIWF